MATWSPDPPIERSSCLAVTSAEPADPLQRRRLDVDRSKTGSPFDAGLVASRAGRSPAGWTGVHSGQGGVSALDAVAVRERSRSLKRSGPPRARPRSLVHGSSRARGRRMLARTYRLLGRGVF